MVDETMMTSCPQCGSKLRVPSTGLTAPIRCPACKTVFNAPHNDVADKTRGKNAAILRLLVIVEIINIVIIMVLGITLDVPGATDSGIFESESLQSGLGILLLLAFILLFLAAIIASWIGLYRLRPWGAKLYLGINIFGLLITPLVGHTYTHAFAAPFESLDSILIGMIIAVAFLTNALDPAESKSEIPSNQDTR